MDKLTKRLGASALTGLFACAISKSGGDTEKIEALNDVFDASAALMISASGSSGVASNFITVGETASFDYKVFYLDSDFTANHDSKNMIYDTNGKILDKT